MQIAFCSSSCSIRKYFTSSSVIFVNTLCLIFIPQLNSNLVGISTNITLSNKVAQAKLTRIGNLVIFESPQDASRLSANYEDIGTIPVGYRPSTPYVNIPIGNIADTNRRYIRITSAGIVQ